VSASFHPTAARLCTALLVAACAGDAPLNPTPPSSLVLSVAGGGNNVADRYSSDLWVHGDYAYTGTWGGSRRHAKWRSFTWTGRGLITSG